MVFQVRIWITWFLAGVAGGSAREWPADLETGFQERGRYVIESTTRSGRYGNTFFENEKKAYGWAMLSILGGEEEAALKFLQEEDNKAKEWNAGTLGIDYYPAFTLKHQIRKYFHFGDRLDPAYRDRMKRAARIFTEKDPYRRPHPAYKPGTPGWTPEARNSWVDIRNTDNLKLMRETSVYLLAEETGNEEVRQLYKRHLEVFVTGLHQVGMSEWDSENYLGHSIAPLVNLHDFAKDPEVKTLATAALDWITVTGALKYRQGVWGGPTKRDYNHPEAFGGSAAMLFWLWFGDAVGKPGHFESDEVHLLTSDYRPPLAAVRLARKAFASGAVQFACKPGLESWTGYRDEQPEFRETQYFGEGFQLGTLWRGTRNPDVNGFKIVLESAEKGAAVIAAAPCSDPTKLGSPMYQDGLLADGSAVGQDRNLAIYLTAPAGQPYLFWMPSGIEVVKRTSGCVVGRRGEHVVAIWPIRLSVPKLSDKLTTAARTGKKSAERWPGVEVWEAKRTVDGHYGFALEISHAAGDASVEAFVQKAIELSPETDELDARIAVSMTGTAGQRVRLQWGADAAGIDVWANGRPSPFNEPGTAFVYRGDLLEQGWHGGCLEVKGEVLGEPARFCFPPSD
ncbi:conserved hypothetical protein [Haloferula helveola]|uniref:Uncharacterized protein n=1 Tax=Haloferula helveola TaxID=490095 RepID=A0ABM7RB39_9BACT|nr:conserved hypothetical protein [Haloferula helveola]